MADRDINIPMGPDRTGRINVPEINPNGGASADQTIAQPPISTADLRNAVAQERKADMDAVDAWLHSPMDSAPSRQVEDDFSPASQTPSSAVPVGEQAREDAFGAQAPSRQERTGSYVSDALLSGGDEAADEALEPEDAKPVNDVAASLGALRDSIGQGRELRAREKDREELAEKIRVDREELADRDDILANYQALVHEQDDIIAQNTQQRDALKAELSQVVAQYEETNEALGRMRDYNDMQLQPLETALGRAQATADQAKNDERSRKSELNAAESEARRAADGDDATKANARLDVAQVAYDEAQARSNSAKETLAEAQRAYDNMKEQVEQAEAPLENSLADLNKRSEELKENVARLGDVISAASKRRQYCDSVYQYPDETERLRQAVMADEDALARLDEENDELRDRLAESKKKSGKAKALIVGVVVFLVLLVLLFWYLSSR